MSLAWALLVLLNSRAQAEPWEEPSPPVPTSTSPLVYSMTLEEYVNLALRKSLRIKIDMDTLESARLLRLGVMRGLYLPTLSATANAAKSYADSDITSPVQTKSATGGLSLTQPFYLTGTNLAVGPSWNSSLSRSLDQTVYTRSRQLPQWNATLTQPFYLFVANPFLRSKLRAELAFATAQDQYNNEVLGVTFDAQQRYYTLLVSQNSVAVERKKFESAQAVYKITQELVKAGKLAPVELARADIRLKLDTRRIQNAQILGQQAVNNLKDLVLLPADADVQLLSPLKYQPVTASIERLLTETLAHNPNLLSAKRQIEVLETNVTEAREGNRPLLNLSGSYQRSRDLSVVDAPRSPYNWNTTLAFTWPFFDATQTALKVRENELAVENARRSYEQLKRQVQVSVRNAFLDVKRLETQLGDFQPQRRTARQNVEAVRLQYENGISRLIDIFDAENESRDLEFEYLGVLQSFNTSRDNLSLLVGVDVRGLKQ